MRRRPPPASHPASSGGRHARPAAVPAPAARAVEDAVEIDAAPSPRSRASKSLTRRLGREHADGVPAAVVIESRRVSSRAASRGRGRDAPTWASAWTPASVRPAPAANTVTPSPAKLRTASSMACWTDEARCLALPADEAGAVIFERQLVARHAAFRVRQPVPVGARSRARTPPPPWGPAGALQLQRSQRAAPQAIVSGHRAPCRVAAAACSLGGEHLDALAIAAKYAPGAGLSARPAVRVRRRAAPVDASSPRGAWRRR